MFTLTCSLRFEDGRVVTAWVRSESRTEDALAHYSGPVERLPLMAAKLTAVELRAYFKSFARELGARYEEEEQDDRVILARQFDEALDYLTALHSTRKSHPAPSGPSWPSAPVHHRRKGSPSAPGELPAT